MVGNREHVGVREPVAVAGPGFPVVCVLFACAEFHVVCVFERSAHFSTEVAYRIALLLFPLHHHFTSCASKGMFASVQTVNYWLTPTFANSSLVLAPLTFYGGKFN